MQIKVKNKRSTRRIRKKRCLDLWIEKSKRFNLVEVKIKYQLNSTAEEQYIDYVSQHKTERPWFEGNGSITWRKQAPSHAKMWIAWKNKGINELSWVDQFLCKDKA